MGDRKVRVADVARGTGLNRSTITALYKETAELVDLEAIDKICEFLDCEVGELFTRDSA